MVYFKLGQRKATKNGFHDNLISASWFSSSTRYLSVCKSAIFVAQQCWEKFYCSFTHKIVSVCFDFVRFPVPIFAKSQFKGQDKHRTENNTENENGKRRDNFFHSNGLGNGRGLTFCGRRDPFVFQFVQLASFFEFLYPTKYNFQNVSDTFLMKAKYVWEWNCKFYAN